MVTIDLQRLHLLHHANHLQRLHKNFNICCHFSSSNSSTKSLYLRMGFCSPIPPSLSLILSSSTPSMVPWLRAPSLIRYSPSNFKIRYGFLPFFLVIIHSSYICTFVIDRHEYFQLIWCADYCFILSHIVGQYICFVRFLYWHFIEQLVGEGNVIN